MNTCVVNICNSDFLRCVMPVFFKRIHFFLSDEMNLEVQYFENMQCMKIIINCCIVNYFEHLNECTKQILISYYIIKLSIKLWGIFSRTHRINTNVHVRLDLDCEKRIAKFGWLKIITSYFFNDESSLLIKIITFFNANRVF